MDLVAHCGWSGAGQFLYTLSMVDVATGWVVCAGLRDKRSETVFHALQRIHAELPFRMLGLDSDNGTEFINRVLLDYCTDHGITFTRSRPYLKNDTCHVEQKNWAVVRRLVGYDRLDLPALPALDRAIGPAVRAETAPGVWSRCHRSPASTVAAAPPQPLRTSATGGVFA